VKVTRLQDVPLAGPGRRSRRVAIGTFDGVHMGHREVIRGNDTVLTFEPHPLTVVHPEATPKLVMPFSIKRDVIAGLGVDELVVIPFDRDFAVREAERFVAEVLIGQLGATSVSVGENFRFGRGARGTADFLASYGEFETRVVPLVEVAGETVSSSQIRGLVAAGEVGKAAEFLGGPFLLEGEVVPGDGRGRELGMPTANVVPDDRLVTPGHGVYAGWAQPHPAEPGASGQSPIPSHPAEPGASGVSPIPSHPAEPGASGVSPIPSHPAEPGASGQSPIPAAISVGVRPTFETGRALLVEPYLLGFEGDLYGEILRIAFVERLRGEKRFESVDALVEQMQADVGRTREICAAQRLLPFRGR